MVLGFDRGFHRAISCTMPAGCLQHRMRMEAGRIRGKKKRKWKKAEAYPLVPFLWIGMLVSVRSAGVKCKRIETFMNGGNQYEEKKVVAVIIAALATGIIVAVKRKKRKYAKAN